MPVREAYHRFKELGICPSCGQRDAKPGATRCAECIEEARQRRDSRASRGLCPRCGKKTRKGRKRCATCRIEDRKTARRIRRVRKAEARCMICGGDIEYAREGHTTCQACGDRRNAHSAARRARDRMEAANA